MKYAVNIVAGQTYLILTKDDIWTSCHLNAVLFDTLEEAKEAQIRTNGDWIDEISDEEEFRQRSDTW